LSKKIAVVDGKGGGLGRSVCEVLSKNKAYELIALGTNALATSNMLKGGASDGATGENAIAIMSEKVDIIIGPISIVSANAMMGEVTEKMALAIGKSSAEKVLLPLQRCGLTVVGVGEMTIKEMLLKLEEQIFKL
jgi:hypothetical protein